MLKRFLLLLFTIMVCDFRIPCIERYIHERPAFLPCRVRMMFFFDMRLFPSSNKKIELHSCNLNVLLFLCTILAIRCFQSIVIYLFLFTLNRT